MLGLPSMVETIPLQECRRKDREKWSTIEGRTRKIPSVEASAFGGASPTCTLNISVLGVRDDIVLLKQILRCGGKGHKREEAENV